jgi:hypothetical protein
MKLFLPGIAALPIFCVAACSAQTTSAAPTPIVPGTTAPQPAPSQPAGKVIFSRSTDENGQTTTQVGPAAPALTNAQLAKEPSAEDAEREAITFTNFDMDVHLRPIEQHIAVRALITVRNDSKSPIAHIPLQLSSSLNWERIRIDAHDVTFPVATLNSDTDHTGQLHEAAISLAQPLAPGQTLQLDVTYSGSIQVSAQRLLAIGTPQDVANHSDWDEISVPFTGLRGFGNVVWYPASSVPVILGDGARLFDEVGEHKLRMAGAHFKVRLTIESPHGRAPTVALVNGHQVALTQTPSGSLSDEVSDVTQAESPEAILGFEAPSLFVAIRSLHSGTNTFYWILPENEASVPAWSSAVDAVTPFLKSWLGQTPRSVLTLLDLPDPQDAPYETGAMLATSIRPASPDQLEGSLAHALTHAWVQSPRAWLSEGVAHFMGTLWVEKKRGRDTALGSLEASRASLAIAEPESPGQSSGQPLAQAISPVYYRTKATYVLWMLRDLVSDATLSATLRAYNPAADVSLGYGRDTAPGTFQMLLEHAGTERDLKWFFSDWVDADKGLPDLSIESVFPTQQPSGSWLVAINLNNEGYAAAEVPVTVRGISSSVTQRIFIPARGKASQRILLQEMPVQVQLNDGTVPETQSTVHITHLNGAANGSSSSQQSPQP